MGKKKRVVAYARVSTDSEKQQNSLENQISYFTRKFQNDKDYRLVNINIEGMAKNGVYYDEGVSGTKLFRPSLNRLLEDAGLRPIYDEGKKTKFYKVSCAPKFDYIYIKDTSRLARNSEIVTIINALKENNVFINFIDTGKTTENPNDTSIIEFFSTMAAADSRDKSNKVSFGYEEGLRNGKIYVGGKIIGYDYHKESNCLTINESEAELVHLVYDLYTKEGLGQHLICERLYELGYKNRKGHKFGRSTIKRMLQNEKYIGVTTGGKYHKKDVLSQKREIRDYNAKIRVEARAAQQRDIEKGIIRIPPIITKEQFDKAQEITKERSETFNIDGTWHGSTDYAGKIICGKCGSIYRAQSRRWSSKHDKKIATYRCKHAVDYDEIAGTPKCDNPSIREDILDDEITSENVYLYAKWIYINIVSRCEYFIRIERAKTDDSVSNEISGLEREIQESKDSKLRILRLYAKGTFTEKELDDEVIKYETTIEKLEERKAELLNNTSEERVNRLLEVRAEAKRQIDSCNRYIKNNKRNTINRRELLADISKIIIRKNGKPSIFYKEAEKAYKILSELEGRDEHSVVSEMEKEYRFSDNKKKLYEWLKTHDDIGGFVSQFVYFKNLE